MWFFQVKTEPLNKRASLDKVLASSIYFAKAIGGVLIQV